jgi:hypothetical protein
MSSLATSLQSPRVQRRLLVVGAVVLIAGVIAVIVRFTQNSGDVTPVNRQGVGVTDVSKVPKSVALSTSARRTAQEFILTAVARKNLRRAYDLAGPQIKQGQTLKQWLTGDIAVIPYPVDELKVATQKIDFSYANEAALEIALVPKKGAGVKPLIFYMDLIKKNGKWLVNSWVPRSAPEVPLAPNN